MFEVRISKWHRKSVSFRIASSWCECMEMSRPARGQTSANAHYPYQRYVSPKTDTTGDLRDPAGRMHLKPNRANPIFPIFEGSHLLLLPLTTLFFLVLLEQLPNFCSCSLSGVSFTICTNFQLHGEARGAEEVLATLVGVF